MRLTAAESKVGNYVRSKADEEAGNRYVAQVTQEQHVKWLHELAEAIGLDLATGEQHSAHL